MRTLRLPLTVSVALVLAAGSVAVAQDEASPAASPDPLRAEGSILTYNEFGPGFPGTRRVDELGITYDEGSGFTATWEWSDPRLSGEVAFISNRSIFEERPGSQLAVGSESFVVTNDGGRWVGQAIGMQVFDQAAYDTIVFRGEGGYEGLSAVMVIDYTKGTQNAVVFPGEMLPMPEPSDASAG